MIKLKFERLGDELRLLDDDELYPDVVFGNRLLPIFDKCLINSQNYICIYLY
jgi:hypothetical protein